jgi:hypothetical protein
MTNRSNLLTGAMLALIAFTAARAADNQTPDEKGHASGKIIVQSVGPGVPVDGRAAPLKLSDEQRNRIREVLATQHTAVSLESKENEAAKSFEPKIDETIPKGLEGEAFPPPLTAEIPATKQFTYLKFKDQILIVNPMDRKIVDLFPQVQG